MEWFDLLYTQRTPKIRSSRVCNGLSYLGEINVGLRSFHLSSEIILPHCKDIHATLATHTSIFGSISVFTKGFHVPRPASIHGLTWSLVSDQ